MPYVIINDCDYPVNAHGFNLPAKGKSRVLGESELRLFMNAAVDGVHIEPLLLEGAAVKQPEVASAEFEQAQPKLDAVIEGRRPTGRHKKVEANE